MVCCLLKPVEVRLIVKRLILLRSGGFEMYGEAS